MQYGIYYKKNLKLLLLRLVLNNRDSRKVIYKLV